jgi:hemoglobin
VTTPLERPGPTHFELIGGAPAVLALVTKFYDLMDASPEAANVRKLHAASLKRSREKLHDFLTGWLGGPQIYVEKHGNPMLRARHLPFAIGEVERDEWLWCMERASHAQEMPEVLRELLPQRHPRAHRSARHTPASQTTRVKGARPGLPPTRWMSPARPNSASRSAVAFVADSTCCPRAA